MDQAPVLEFPLVLKVFVLPPEAVTVLPVATTPTELLEGFRIEGLGD